MHSGKLGKQNNNQIHICLISKYRNSCSFGAIYNKTKGQIYIIKPFTTTFILAKQRKRKFHMQ